MNQKMSLRNMIIMGGAVVSFCIGSGFATGQELMQFFTVYGTKGILGAILSGCLYIYTCVSFIHIGATAGLSNSNQIFEHVTGKYLGKFFSLYAGILVFLFYVIMLSGAGAIFEEYYNLPSVVGQTMMLVLVMPSVIFGFKRLIDIIGSVGPIIIIGMILLCIISIFKSTSTLAEADAYLAAGGSSEILAASSDYRMSGILYTTYMDLPLAPFIAALATRANSPKEGRVGVGIGMVAFTVTMILVTVCELFYISDVASAQVPLLLVAKKSIPMFAVGFSVLLLCGIYSTAAPSLWTAVSMFAEDESKRFKPVVFILAMIGYVVSFLPFRTLVNVVYSYSGWIAILFVVIMFIQQMRDLLQKKS